MRSLICCSDYRRSKGGDLQSHMWTFEGQLGEVQLRNRLGFIIHLPNKGMAVGTDYNLMWADENPVQMTAAAVMALRRFPQAAISAVVV